MFVVSGPLLKDIASLFLRLSLSQKYIKPHMIAQWRLLDGIGQLA